MPKVNKLIAFKKCQRCRQDRQKCLPEDRTWPGEKCDRCVHFGYLCSANRTAAEEVTGAHDSAPNGVQVETPVATIDTPVDNKESDEALLQRHSDLYQLVHCIDTIYNLHQYGFDRNGISILLRTTSVNLDRRAKEFRENSRLRDGILIQSKMLYHQLPMSLGLSLDFDMTLRNDFDHFEELVNLQQQLGDADEVLRLRESAVVGNLRTQHSCLLLLESYNAFIERVSNVQEFWRPLAKLSIAHRIIRLSMKLRDHDHDMLLKWVALNLDGMTFHQCSSPSEILALIVHMAAMYDNHEAAKLLLECGYDSKEGRVTIESCHLRSIGTPLHTAARHGCTKFIENFKGVADLNVTDRLGKTPLHGAIICNKIDAVRALLASPDVSFDQLRQDGHTVFHLVVINNHFDSNKILEMLLALSTRGINIPDKSQNTPLHLALQPPYFNLAKAKMLIVHGAAMSILDRQGANALHYVADEGIRNELVDTFLFGKKT